MWHPEREKIKSVHNLRLKNYLNEKKIKSINFKKEIFNLWNNKKYVKNIIILNTL